MPQTLTAAWRSTRRKFRCQIGSAEDLHTSSPSGSVVRIISIARHFELIPARQLDAKAVVLELSGDRLQRRRIAHLKARLTQRRRMHRSAGRAAEPRRRSGRLRCGLASASHAPVQLHRAESCPSRQCHTPRAGYDPALIPPYHLRACDLILSLRLRSGYSVAIHTGIQRGDDDAYRGYDAHQLISPRAPRRRAWQWLYRPRNLSRGIRTDVLLAPARSRPLRASSSSRSDDDAQSRPAED